MRLLTAVLLSFVMGSCLAAGGFSETAPAKQQAGTDSFYNLEPRQVSTLKDVMRMNDKSMVRVRGNIVKATGQPQHYTFEDKTGTIKLEIRDEVWAGQDVSPDNTIEVLGKLDIDSWSTEIKVKQLRIVK